MTKQEKQLLLVDLCGRLLYGIRVKLWYQVQNNNPLVLDEEGKIESLYVASQILHDIETGKIKDFKPYLRPMDSMTEEEFNYVNKKFKIKHVKSKSGCYTTIPTMYIDKYTDWLNANHFDYHTIKDKDGKEKTMIEYGLALEAPPDMYLICTTQ